MKISILHDVKPEVAEECGKITGSSVTIQKPEGADIQIILRKFVPTEKLKMIQTVSAGVDHLKFEELPENVTLCSNAGAFSDPVAEHAFAMLLAHAKRICKFNSDTKNGTYKRERVDSMFGLTFGILGHGGIGRSSARIARALGMKVIAYTRSPKEDENVDQFVKTPEEIFTGSDVLLIALPLSKATKDFVNDGFLKMFRGSVLINVARADIVHEGSMKEYLSSHPDVVYLSDVWWNEPEISFPIPGNVMLTPHVGGISRESTEKAVLRACQNVRRYMDGNPDNIVNVSEYRK